MTTLHYSFLISILTTFLFTACTTDETVVTPDVSDIPMEVNIKRFEQELFSLDTNNLELGMAGQVAALQKKYPAFYEVFTKKILTEEMMPADEEVAMLEDFIKHPSVRHLYDTTQVIYNDIRPLEEDLEQAFRYLKLYFPEKPTPEVVSFVSEYVVGTFTYGDSLLAIGWDFFLGEEFPYDHRIFPQYIQRSMDRPHLVAKSIETLASNMVGPAEGKRMIDQMITNGKILYIEKLLLPTTPDSIIMEYSPQQMQWVLDNERETWSYLLREDLLYSSRTSDFQKLIGPSPTGTSQMPPESPGKVGNWLGWQIVAKFMEQNPEVTPSELLAIRDAQEILSKSKYKPRK